MTEPKRWERTEPKPSENATRHTYVVEATIRREYDVVTEDSDPEGGMEELKKLLVPDKFESWRVLGESHEVALVHQPPSSKVRSDSPDWRRLLESAANWLDVAIATGAFEARVEARDFVARARRALRGE